MTDGMTKIEERIVNILANADENDRLLHTARGIIAAMCETDEQQTAVIRATIMREAAVNILDPQWAIAWSILELRGEVVAIHMAIDDLATEVRNK